MSVKTHRVVNHFSRDYHVKRISNNGEKAHFELTTMNAFTGEVLEVITFDDVVQADTGLLDRICVR